MATPTADDLLSPKGRFIPKIHFPGQSLKKVKAKFGMFLTLAATEGEDITEEADLNAFMVARAEYRGFDEVYQRLIIVAASITDSDEGSRQYLAQQIAAVEAERAKAQGIADDLLGTVTDVPYPVLKESRSIPIVFTGPHTGRFHRRGDRGRLVE